MVETREITLTNENWKKIDELLERIPESDFFRFCLLNDIVEKGLESLEEHFAMNKLFYTLPYILLAAP